MTGGSPLNPIAARALRSSLRPRSLLGLVGAALLVLAAAAEGWPRTPIPRASLRGDTRLRSGLCRAELIAAPGCRRSDHRLPRTSIASERQERTWTTALVQSALSDTAELVLGKAAGVLRPPRCSRYSSSPLTWSTELPGACPWGIIIIIQVVFFGGRDGRGRCGSARLVGVRPRAPCRRASRGRDHLRVVRRAGWPCRQDGPATRLAVGGSSARACSTILSHRRCPPRPPWCACWPSCSGAGLEGGLAFLAAIRLAPAPDRRNRCCRTRHFSATARQDRARRLGRPSLLALGMPLTRRPAGSSESAACYSWGSRSS